MRSKICEFTDATVTPPWRHRGAIVAPPWPQPTKHVAQVSRRVDFLHPALSLLHQRLPHRVSSSVEQVGLLSQACYRCYPTPPCTTIRSTETSTCTWKTLEGWPDL